MAGSVAEIRIEGAANLERAFHQLRLEVLAELKVAIREAIKPVKEQAERDLPGVLSNIGPNWDRMRTGVTLNGAYMVPTQRGGHAPTRANFKPAVQGVMDAALEANKDRINAEVDAIIAASAAKNGFL